ncbi:MAG: ATP synthase F1 subunit delta, partial [Planctomycetia bacterium]
MSSGFSTPTGGFASTSAETIPSVMDGGSFEEMGEARVAEVYAMALWGLAEDAGTTQSVVEEVGVLVREFLDPHPELEVFFSLGSITQSRRAEMIDRVFANRFSDAVYGFLHTLNRRGRLGVLRSVARRLQERWDDSQGRVAVVARTAAPLAGDQVTALLNMLRERFKIEPVLKTGVDPGLLGGLWLRVGDTVYDQSLL